MPPRRSRSAGRSARLLPVLRPAHREREPAHLLDDDRVALPELVVLVRPAATGAPQRAVHEHLAAAVAPAANYSDAAAQRLTPRGGAQAAGSERLSRGNGE